MTGTTGAVGSRTGEATPSPNEALPSLRRPRGRAELVTLFEGGAARGSRVRGGLPPRLAAEYGGDLAIPLVADRPTIVANFVETLDGIVALDADGETGGGEVSGFNPADRFVMALLRGMADAVLVGAATVRASDGGAWTPARMRPDLAEEFARLRSRLGLAPQPTTLIVTASGRLDPAHPGLRDPEVPVVIAAGHDAADRLRRHAWPANVRIEPLSERLPLGRGIVDVATRLGLRLVLSEAGPHVMSQLLDDRLVDELFLTIAPQLAGRGARVDRLSLVEGQPLWPERPTWLELASVRRGGDHLFLRYRSEENVR